MNTTECNCRTGAYQVYGLKVADYPDWEIQAHASLDAPTSMPRAGVIKSEIEGFTAYAVVGVPIRARHKMREAA